MGFPGAPLSLVPQAVILCFSWELVASPPFPLCNLLSFL